MRHLLQQWKLLRHLDMMVHLADDESPSTWNLDPAARATDVANSYAKDNGMLFIDGERLVKSCIEDGYVSQRVDDDGTFIWVSPGNGQKFLAIFSGLILGELKELGPLWTFVSGVALPILIWLITYGITK